MKVVTRMLLAFGLLLAVSAAHAADRRTLLQALETGSLEAPVPGPAFMAPEQAPVVAPAPVQVPVSAPVPAPVTALPAPAPQPVFAPVPAPAPAYVPPPLCGVEPQCKLVVEDMLCCKDTGLQNNKPAAVAWLLCTHFTALPASCLSVSGPANVSVYDIFNDDLVYSRRHRFVVNYVNTTNYTGPVTLSVEANRTRPECALNIAPCLFNNVTVNTTAPVPALKFVSQNSTNFAAGLMGCGSYDLGLLDSWAWVNKNGTCSQELTRSLPQPFFTEAKWLNYTETIGFSQTCNVTAQLETVNAFKPINATIIAQNISDANTKAAAVTSSSVSN